MTAIAAGNQRVARCMSEGRAESLTGLRFAQAVVDRAWQEHRVRFLRRHARIAELAGGIEEFGVAAAFGCAVFEVVLGALRQHGFQAMGAVFHGWAGTGLRLRARASSAQRLLTAARLTRLRLPISAIEQLS